jgi:hypothetical protein
MGYFMLYILLLLGCCWLATKNPLAAFMGFVTALTLLAKVVMMR